MKTVYKSGSAIFGFLISAASLVLAPATQAQSVFTTPYTFTTLAGTAGTGGVTNATGAAASFFYPGGVAVDPSGNIYVADAANNVIRKVTSAGVVTTFAGQYGAAAGTFDGTGSGIQFSALGGVAVDTKGNVYVADIINSTIRKITPGGVSSTVAGTPGVQGFANGPSFSAQFNRPNAVAVDGAGNLYVADTGNGVIRKVSIAGTVTTLAGVPGGFGTVNGTGGVALFNGLFGIAVDVSGNVFVSDSTAGVIRKVTPTGTVTTFAGTAGLFGSADGTGTAALFNAPGFISTDGAGNIYVADTNNSAIRRITPAGVVSTLGGQPLGVITTNPGAPIVTGSKDGTGSVAQFNFPKGVTATVGGNIYVTDTLNFTLRAGVPATVPSVAAPTLSTQVQSVSAAAGANVTFSVAAVGSNLTYQWSFNGTAISGATSSTLSVSKIAAANAGAYTVTVTNSSGSITSGAATLAIVTPPASSNYTGAYAVTTLAGTAGSSGTTLGTGAAARFTSPVGSAVDAAGNVYVTDAGSATVLKITPAGVVTNFAGNAGLFGSTNGTGNAALFVLPYGAAVDASGNVYISDYGSGTIRKITSAGVSSTLAGTPGVIGSADGTGAAVQFYNPAGIAVDAAGNVYVADSFNDVVRKITAAGVSSTLAGTAGTSGAANGTGAAAQFNFPDAVAVDSGGNVYVADGFNNTIRKITSAGVVTTLAGTAGVTGSADGTGAAAQFNLPQGLTVDTSGNVYVTDGGNDTIRKITSAGVVTTLAGIAGTAGALDGTGPTAEFNTPYGIAVDASANLYVADTLNGTVRKAATPVAPPVITAQPQAVSVNVGSPFSLSVTATGAGTLTYQWALGGTPISGATSATFSVAAAAVANGGSYTVTVSNAGGSVVSSAAVVTVTAVAAPAITAQPQSTTVTTGSALSLSVTATGGGTLAYQWFLAGTAISGATSSTYSVTAAAAANAGSYTVTVSNAGGSVTSSAATVTVNAPAAPAASSGGGGAPSLWFYAALVLLVGLRQASRRQRQAAA